MREVTANTIGKKPDTNPSNQKLLDKKRRDVLRRERIRKFRKKLGFFEHDDFSHRFLFEINSLVAYLLET